jgi:hypothetical protein
VELQVTFHLFCTVCRRWWVGYGRVDRCCGELPEVIDRKG